MLTQAQRICVFTLAVTGLFAQSTPVPEARTSGMIGLAYGQTARINVLNKGVLPPAVGAVCSATLAFYDGQGTLLKSMPVPTINPGTAAYLDITDMDLALATNQRKEIRATISVPAPTPVASATSSEPNIPAGCNLVGTLEVFDSLTGRTEAVLGGMHVVPSAVAAGAARR